jgi:hypothetical protein
MEPLHINAYSTRRVSTVLLIGEQTQEMFAIGNAFLVDLRLEAGGTHQRPFPLQRIKQLSDPQCRPPQSPSGATGSACWIAKKAPSRLVRNTTSQSAGFMRTAKPSRAIPGNGGHDGAKRLPCSCPILPGKTTRSRDREDSGYKRLAELFRRTSGKFRGLFDNNS